MALDSRIVHRAGRMVGAGTYRCEGCGSALALGALEVLPACPICGSSRFGKASMFRALDETVESDTIEEEPEPSWIVETRRELDRAGFFLAHRDGDRRVVTEVDRGWIRIGRSAAADLQLDDPTVSRRHAIVVRTDDEQLRVIDDRSMNGVFVNGERTDWAALDDGDEVAIGRFHLHVIETDPSGAPLPHTARRLPA